MGQNAITISFLITGYFSIDSETKSIYLDLMEGSSIGERLAEFSEAVRNSSLKRLRMVPSGMENRRVSPDAMSFADTVRHLIDADKWLFRKLEERDLPSMTGKPGVEDIKSRDQYLELLDELERIGARRTEIFRNMTDDQFSEIICDDRFDGEVTVWWVIIRGNLDHEIHHRGQIAAYQRMI